MRFFFQGKSILLLNLLMYKQNKPIKKKLKLKLKKKKKKAISSKHNEYYYNCIIACI